MTDNPFSQSNPSPDAAAFRPLPNPSESFGKVPHATATFGNVPNVSEPFRNVPQTASRKQNHTLTVREVARRFETAGVARSERSIINWCQKDALGVSRLDAYYDPNERRYFITPESVEWAIAEEQAKAARVNEGTSIPQGAEPAKQTVPKASQTAPESAELLKEIMDLKITNRAKDLFIEQLKQEQDGLLKEVVSSNRKIGELQTQLLQLSAPEMAKERRLPVRSGEEASDGFTV